jgi:hypothetical protein
VPTSREYVLTTYSTINSTRHLLPPPLLPLLLLPALVIHRPSSHRLLSSKNLPPNIVNCHRRHHPLSSHRPPPRRLTCRILRHPPSAQRHRHRCHCCNPVLFPTTLFAPSASYCPLLARFPPAPTIVTATPSLLRPLSLLFRRLLSSRQPPASATTSPLPLSP